MQNYTFNLSDGSTLFSLLPQEQSGPGNLSTPRNILDIDVITGTGQIVFVFADDLTARFVGGFQFDVVGAAGYQGTYTVSPGGSVVVTVGSKRVTRVPVDESLAGLTTDVFKIDSTNKLFYVDYPSSTPFVPTTSITLSGNTNAPSNGTYTISTATTTSSDAITAVDSGGGNSWTIAGDKVTSYPVGKQVRILGNSGGNGTYTITSVTTTIATTTVVVAEDIPNTSNTAGTISVYPPVTIIEVVEVVPALSGNNGTITTSAPSPVSFSLTAAPVLVSPVSAGLFNVRFTVAGDQTALFSPFIISGEGVLIKNNNILKFNTVPVVAVALNSGNTQITVRYSSSTTPIVTATGVVITPPLSIPYGYVQYSVSDTASSLKLVGKGSTMYNSTVSWGEAIQNNLINIVENFAFTSAPVTPLKGQLWFDTTGTTQLKLRDGTNTSWKQVVTTDIPVQGTVDMNSQFTINPAIRYNPLYGYPNAISFASGTAAYIDFASGSTGGINLQGANDILFPVASTGKILLTGAANTLALSGGSNMTLAGTSSISFPGVGHIDMGGNTINNVGLPATGTDAANKSYVDGLSNGIIWISPVLDPTLYDDSLTTPPITNGTIPTTAPQLSVTYHKTYIVPTGATGDWSTLIGKAVQYVYDIPTAGWKWIDILGRNVAVGDRFIVFGMPDQGDNLSIVGNLAQGGLTGHTGKIATVTGVGPYTYTFATPVEPYAISVTGVSPGSPSFSTTVSQSSYVGYSFTFRGTHGSGVYGAGYRWIQFNGPQALIDGGGLRFTGNILNIGAGTGVTINADNVALDLTYLGNNYLKLDGTNNLASPLNGLNGGTGVNNSGKTITLGGNLVTAGAFTITLTSTGNTAVTLPLTGILVGSNDTNTVTNAMLVNSTISGVSLGNNLNTLTFGNSLSGTSYNGSTAITVAVSDIDTNTIVATAATGTIDIDLSTSRNYLYTTDATANWTFNFRGTSGISLNTLMSVGQSIQTQIAVKNGVAAFYSSAHTIDGSAVTPLFKLGVPFAAGNVNSTDVYTYTIIKTGAATFTVFAEQNRFA